MAVTRLGGWGGPRSPCGSFAGKILATEFPRPAVPVLTRLGGYGGPRLPFGSFAGKVEADIPVEVPEARRRGGYVPYYDGEQPYRRRDRQKQAQEAALDDVLRRAYAEATGEDGPEIAATVAPYVTGRGRPATRSAPSIERVDFARLARDEARANRLLEIAERRLQRIQDEEAVALLLLMAA